MPLRRYVSLTAALVTVFACSTGCDGTASNWGETCVTEREGRYSYDSSAPEQSCVDLINSYRAELGKAPLSRWNAGEGCAVTEATSDAASDEAHGAFGACGELAQNTCPKFASVDSVLGGCLLAMFCEGPSPSGKWDSSHGHHMNMLNGDYTMVACGFYRQTDGRYWVNMNFK